MFNNLFIPEEGKEKLITTTTGETFIPVRLYYKIHNKALLIKAIKKLKCASFAEFDENYFIISYYKEAKKLNLEVFYQDIPRELYPITLANCYIKNNSTLCIDLKSMARAIEIIDFLSKHIRPFNILEITSIAHKNHVTSCKDEEELHDKFYPDYDELFDHLVDDRSEYLTQYMEEVKKKEGDFADIDELSKEKIKINLFANLHEQEKNNYPLAEKINIQYKRSEHDDLLYMLTYRFAVKQCVALKRHEGNKDFTSFDALEDLFRFASKEKD